MGFHEKEDDRDENELAQKAENAAAHHWKVTFIDEHHGKDDDNQVKEIDFSFEADGGNLLDVALLVCQGFLFVIVAINPVINCHQNQSGNQPLREKMHKPEKWRSAQVQQKERGISQRGEDAAAVGYHRDEKQDGMRAVFALAVGFQQETNQQHRRPGCPHQGCEKIAHRENAAVDAGCRRQVALQMDAPRHDEQREQEQDERNVVEEHLMKYRFTQSHSSQHTSRRNGDGRRRAGHCPVPPWRHWHT